MQPIVHSIFRTIVPAHTYTNAELTVPEIVTYEPFGTNEQSQTWEVYANDVLVAYVERFWIGDETVAFQDISMNHPTTGLLIDGWERVDSHKWEHETGAIYQIMGE